MGLLSFFGKRAWYQRRDAGKVVKLRGEVKHQPAAVPIVIGTLAHEGFVFIAQSELHDEVDTLLEIRGKAVAARVKLEKVEPFVQNGKPIWRYTGTFTGIAADAYDAVVRFLEDKPEPATFVAPVIEHDDDFRTLKEIVQQRIVHELIERRRLLAPANGAQPLIRMKAQPVRQLANGQTYRDVAIHSRVAEGTEIANYDTKFRIHGDDRVELLR